MISTTRTRLVPALLLVAALLAAGCTTGDAPAPEPQAAALEPAGAAANVTATGSLAVLARMPDATLLPGVNVTVGNESRLTDATGLARFEALPAGSHAIEARKEAHRTAQQSVEIVAGEETRVEIVLAAAGNDQHAHENGVSAHRDHYRFEGHFDCSATYLIITGDCLVVVQNATATAGAPDPASGATTERHIIDFPLDLNWTTLVVEMEWQAGAPTPATGEGMTLALEPAEAPADGHAAKYARAEGVSPLAVRLEAGVQHETATAEDMPNPEGGEVIRARAFVMGAAHRPAGTPFLGAGASAGQSFTLHVSIFYGEPAPEGYTALGS